GMDPSSQSEQWPDQRPNQRLCERNFWFQGTCDGHLQHVGNDMDHWLGVHFNILSRALRAPVKNRWTLRGGFKNLWREWTGNIPQGHSSFALACTSLLIPAHLRSSSRGFRY